MSTSLTVRHNRAEAFADAWQQPVISATPDPSDPTAVADRARTLANAWIPHVEDRVDFIVDRCRGKAVLDIGCVAHDAARMDDPQWLHRHVATAAEACIGVDILEEGVETLRTAGFDAIVHDLSTGLGPLTDRAPFDRIIAGEVIEHLGDLDLLFRVAAMGLGSDGQLILTTPNPYAPARVEAGQRGVIWENTDHVSYLFPAGIAELARRHGLVLREATTVVAPEPVGIVRRAKQWLRASGWRLVGYDTTGRTGRQIALPITRWRDRVGARRGMRFIGETAIYVISRTDA
ncbi:MAG: methyltransferase domain-containing protein [Actinomycetota bacterium]